MGVLFGWFTLDKPFSCDLELTLFDLDLEGMSIDQKIFVEQLDSSYI